MSSPLIERNMSHHLRPRWYTKNWPAKNTHAHIYAQALNMTQRDLLLLQKVLVEYYRQVHFIKQLPRECDGKPLKNKCIAEAYEFLRPFLIKVEVPSDWLDKALDLISARCESLFISFTLEGYFAKDGTFAPKWYAFWEQRLGCTSTIGADSALVSSMQNLTIAKTPFNITSLPQELLDEIVAYVLEDDPYEIVIYYADSRGHQYSKKSRTPALLFANKLFNATTMGQLKRLPLIIRWEDQPCVLDEEFSYPLKPRARLEDRYALPTKLLQQVTKVRFDFDVLWGRSTLHNHAFYARLAEIWGQENRLTSVVMHVPPCRELLCKKPPAIAQTAEFEAAISCIARPFGDVLTWDPTDLCTVTSDRGWGDHNALCDVIDTGDLELLRLVMEKFPDGMCEQYARMEHGGMRVCTALEHATYYSSSQIVQLILGAKGVDMGYKNVNGWTVSMLAEERGDQDVIDMIQQAEQSTL